MGRFVPSEKNLNDGMWKLRLEKSFFQVVNETRAASFPDKADFFRPRFAKVDVLR